MENLDFTFKKNRSIGDLISDYITLFKRIFKHLHRVFIPLALVFASLLVIGTFFFLGNTLPIFNAYNRASSVTAILSFEIPLNLIIFIFSILVFGLGMEYFILLEERNATDFSFKDVLKRWKGDIGKFILFFLSSLVVILILIIPLGLVGLILVLIPIVGFIGLMILSGIVSLYFNVALMLYLQGRSSLWKSYSDSIQLIYHKMFAYGLASFLFQFLSEIVMGIVLIVPTIILVIITFSTGINVDFFTSFGGKFILSIGVALLAIFYVFYSIYLISFYVLEYFSLIEVNYNEETMEDIDQIGKTQNED